MNFSTQTFLVPVTPEYVLDVIKVSHRQQCKYDPEADPDIELTFDSTIEDWRWACDLVGWRRLSRSLNNWFRVSISESEWQQVLTPAKVKTLREVCKLIASRRARLEIKPVPIFGKPCCSASLFLYLRKCLIDAGADGHSIRPKASLNIFNHRYPEVFNDCLANLAPGKNFFEVLMVDKPPICGVYHKISMTCAAFLLLSGPLFIPAWFGLKLWCVLAVFSLLTMIASTILETLAHNRSVIYEARLKDFKTFAEFIRFVDLKLKSQDWERGSA